MSEKVTKIHEFDPQIYPRLVWIAVGANVSCLRDMFGDDIDEMDKDADADVTRVTRQKPTKRAGLLIRFRSKAAMTTGTITHESDHVALEIFNYCECAITPDNQETFTYLAGWIADCCQQVKSGKFK